MMKNEPKIIQMHICTDHDSMQNYMILLFVVDKKVIGISVVEYPDWFKFWDEQYKFYPFCYN